MPDVQTNFKKRTRSKRGGATAWKNKATAAHSQYVRARAGYRCERCGKTDARMECAHIFSRRYTATRTDENGAWCLCSGCHRYLTENPFEHVKFAYDTLGHTAYARLRDKAYAGVGSVMKTEFWRGEYERLAAKLKEIEQ